MKKILSLVLIVATLASLVVFAPTAGAEGAYATVETTNAVGAVGSTVTVDVIVTAPLSDTLQLNFHYDRTRLELVTTDKGLNAIFHGEDVTGNNLDNGPALKEWNGDNGTDGDYYALFENITASYDAAVAFESRKVATITFKIKDNAPLGDAYVEFCDVGGASTYVATGATKHYGDEIAYTSSVVTVLPAGTLPATPTPVEDFTISNGAIKTYNGDASVVVIPSTDASGNPITTINTGAFADKSMTTLVIPASVTTIKKGAVGNCANLTSVYILGEPTTYAEAAIGWVGTYKNNRGVVSFTIDPEVGDGVLCEEVEPEWWVPVTTIYIPAGSSLAATLDEDVDAFETIVPYETNDKVYMVSAGNVAYLAPANTKAPGQMVVDGKTVLNWKNGDEVVNPGADLTLTGDLNLDLGPSVALPATTRTQSMKLSADTKALGMRFTSTLSHADYEAMAALGTVKLGMIITPNQYVERAGAFTKAALNTIGAANAAYVDVAINGYYKDDGTTYTLAASLVGYSEKTLANNIAFAAVTYAEIDTNGDGNADITVYGQYDLATVRSVKDVALSVKNATYPEGEGLSDEQIGWLDTLLGKIGA